MNIRDKKFKCQEINCNNQISYNTWKYGLGRCRSCANIGSRNPRYGKEAISKNSIVRLKISKALKGNTNASGRILTEEHKRKIGESNKGKIPSKKTIEASKKARQSGSNRGSNHYLFGKHHSEETKRKMSEKAKLKFGRENNNWQGGKTYLNLLIRTFSEYKNWRKQIFERDNFTCQKCGQHDVYLEAHHKIQFTKIMKEFLKEYDQFSPIEDKETLARLAMKYKPLWDITNGQTLCKDCHNLTKKAVASYE